LDHRGRMSQEVEEKCITIRFMISDLHETSERENNVYYSSSPKILTAWKTWKLWNDINLRLTKQCEKLCIGFIWLSSSSEGV
jgi:hypothetical protein